jgi:membrane-associated phospholipid phosphatase
MKKSIVNQEIALAFVLLLVIAIVLSYAASKFAVLPLDLKSYHELREEASPSFNMLMQGVSFLGDAAAATALVIFAVTIFVIRRQWLEAIFMLATTSNILITLTLKELIHRARPFPIAENANGLLQGANQYSYPSGHVLFFVVFFGFFAYLAWLHIAGRVRVIAIAICAALIILIGPSRVFLGAHWATDVAGGYIIGLIWLFGLIFAYQWAIHRKIDNLLQETSDR